MNPKEIIAATLSGQPAPRIPNGMLAGHSCAGSAGYSLQRRTTDPIAMADSVIRYPERFKPDAVWLSADTWISAEAMGARVGSTGEDQPAGGKPRRPRPSQSGIGWPSMTPAQAMELWLIAGVSCGTR